MSTPLRLLGRLGRRRSTPAAAPARRGAADCRKERAEVLALYGWGIRGAIVVGGLALLFTMVNVQIFGSAGHQPGTDMASTFLWGIAWLLDPMASVGLGVAILFEGLLARYGRSEAWLTGVKWFAGLMTWTMNIWPAIDRPHPSGLAAGVVLHSLAPGLVLGLAEAAPRVRRKVTEIIAELEREARSIEAQDAQRHAAQHRQRQAVAEQPAPPSAPIGPPAPALRAFPNRPDFAPAVRPAQDPPDRSLGRPTEPTQADPATQPDPARSARPAPVARTARAGRQRTGEPRTDAQLSKKVREIAERTGGTPSQYQLKRALGVGSGRAARLLAELATTTPAGDPATNGVATRTEDAR